VVLGLCSPFVSEDNTILLRSLLGRTCTMLHTCGGRHNIQGLYVDTIMNERRLKGERHRKNIWLGWMAFLSDIAGLCARSTKRHRENCPRPDDFRPYSMKYRYSEFVDAHGEEAEEDRATSGEAQETNYDSNIRVSKAAMVDVRCSESGNNAEVRYRTDKRRDAAITGFEVMRPSQQASGKLDASRRSFVVENTFQSLNAFSRASISSAREGREPPATATATTAGNADAIVNGRFSSNLTSSCMLNIYAK
jgi:hypothetical protein